MSRRFIGPMVASACILIVAATGVALQPERGGGRPPQGQPGERQPGGPGGERGERGGQPGGPRAAASVEAGMKGMNRALRQLSAQVGDSSKREENLRLVNEMQRGAVNAKMAALPDTVLSKAKDDAGKAKMVEEYRREMIKVMRLLLDIETDLADGKGADAKAKLEQLTKVRDHGHEEMGVKD